MLEFEVLSRHNSDELRKTAKKLRYNTWSLGRDFNPQATKHATHTSTTFSNINTVQNMFKNKEVFQYSGPLTYKLNSFARAGRN
jgi:hypothetical protein